MMTLRSFLLAATLVAAGAAPALAQQNSDFIASPVLHANVTVAGDLVRIGDLVDNAGSFGQIAVYRAPDLGTSGTIPTAQVLAALRAHQVIGVDTRNIREVTVTRLARTVASREIELAVAHALERRNGLGDAANLTLTFDGNMSDLQLDAANNGAMQATSVRFEPRSGRFDVSFEIANEATGAPTRLRFTGTAIETVEAAVLTRNVDRSDLLKSADIVIERRTKAEIGGDAASREQALGMQTRRPMRAGQPLRNADLVKPDLVLRDQSVTVIYETPGLYLTTRGKALDSGTEGDVVNVLNPQSKRTLTGVVTGRGQVTIQVATPKPADDVTSSIAPEPPAAPVAKASPSGAETGSRDDTTSGPRAAAPQASSQFRSQAALKTAFPGRLSSRSRSHSKSRVGFMSRSRVRRLLVAGSALMVLSVASGCSSIDRLSQIGEQPKLAAIENPTAQPGYKPVQMPMPKPETVSYNPNSLWRNGSRAFFKDQRASHIGDILTVTVNITDKANIANETQRSRTNKEDSGVTDFAGSKLLSGTAAQVMPGRLLTADSTASSDGKGSVQRQEALQTNVAAVVTQVLPNGNLVVEGKQEIRVNYEIRELVVAGIVRPEDIQSDNTIDSSKIAQARIAYGGRGQISDVQQPRYGQQVMDILLPF